MKDILILKEIGIERKYTGSKLLDLENNNDISELYNVIQTGKSGYWTEQEKRAWLLIQQTMLTVSEKSICPISGASYSALLFYHRDKKLFIHAGANIDPESKDKFARTEYRNCAERQAAISAADVDHLTNNDLKMIFLYRKQASTHHHVAEKLLPCSDCNSKYMQALVANGGHLILILDDNHHREFLEGGSTLSDQLVHTVSMGSTIVNYKIFSSELIPRLKMETQLASRVCNKS